MGLALPPFRKSKVDPLFAWPVKAVRNPQGFHASRRGGNGALISGVFGKSRPVPWMPDHTPAFSLTAVMLAKRLRPCRPEPDAIVEASSSILVTGAKPEAGTIPPLGGAAVPTRTKGRSFRRLKMTPKAQRRRWFRQHNRRLREKALRSQTNDHEKPAE
jgi:hypothetical protein